VDEQGHTIDFYLSQTRKSKAAKRFLGKALQGFKEEEKPSLIHSDKAPTYGKAIAALRREGKFPDTIAHRQIKISQQHHRGRPRQTQTLDQGFHDRIFG
jgi:transposase, IS6 family